MPIINRACLDRRTQAIGCVAEGKSIRSMMQIGMQLNTVMRLLVKVDSVCSALKDDQMPSYRAHASRSMKSGPGSKKAEENNAQGNDPLKVVHPWTFRNLDTVTKLVPECRSGNRAILNAKAFIVTLAGGLANYMQISFDAVATGVALTEQALGVHVNDRRL
jgi:hypothetical protein